MESQPISGSTTDRVEAFVLNNASEVTEEGGTTRQGQLTPELTLLVSLTEEGLTPELTLYWGLRVLPSIKPHEDRSRAVTQQLAAT